MAFQRKGRRPTSSKKLETRAHASRAYKHVVRQWWLSLNVKCQVVASDPTAECPNNGVIFLIAPGLIQGVGSAALGANFADTMSIRRIDGNMYFQPQNSLVPPVGFTDCVDQVADQANHNVYMRMGLKKVEGAQSNAGVSPGFNPLNNGATPFELSDYVDGRWLKMWEHLWGASGTIDYNISNNFNCCSVRDGYPVPATVEGTQVGYNVPPIICEPCGDPENPAANLACGGTAKTHDWWRVPIRFGRRLVLKESDHLALYFGWERLQSLTDVARLPQPKMKWFGGIRLLLES